MCGKKAFGQNYLSQQVLRIILMHFFTQCAACVPKPASVSVTATSEESVVMNTVLRQS